ncbi:MAG: tetratricopeptide repeat protein [Bacteroidota bacterium]
MSKKDTTKVNILNTLFIEYVDKEPVKALMYSKEALALAEELGYTIGISVALNNIAGNYWSQGNYEESLKYLLRALKINERQGDKLKISNSLGNVGLLYWKLGNINKALEYQLNSLKIIEELEQEEDEAYCLGNIGILYREQGNKTKALEYYNRSLKIQKKIGDKEGIALSLNNIGNVYADQGFREKALDNYFKSLRIWKEQGNKNDMAMIYNNIGLIYKDLAKISRKSSDFKKGIKYLDSSLVLAKELGANDLLKEAYLPLSDIYNDMGNCGEAYKYYKLYSDIKDTLLNAETTRSFAQMQTLYETEKKDKEIILLNKDKEIQDVELNKQRLVRNSFIGGFLLLLLVALSIFRGYKQKQKANTKLTAQNQIIEEKNKDITDSINYARRIQNAILPSIDLIYETLEDSFVLYKPKDIVSGDFYTFIKKNDKVIIAAADCTGHGVPGAFMSMIGNNQLNHIIIEKEILQPSEILNNLHEGIRSALKQDIAEGQTRDGMDIALCSIDLKQKEIQYAGANRPLYLLKNGQLEEIKANKFSIGGLQSEDKRKFNNHIIPISASDSMYIFTDGYADQFGANSGKKFMTKRFKELLFSIQDKSMKEQKTILDDTIEKWKGNLEQVDDILVIGIRF